MSNIVAAGFLINSALYLAGVIAAGLVCGNRYAVVLAITSAGLAFLCYSAQAASSKRWLAVGLHIASDGAGVVAGLVLLWGYFR